jgi:hypothetical protein
MCKPKLVKAAVILIASVCFSYLNCTKESNETEGSIAGVVTDQGSEAIIHPAYIFLIDYNE